MGCVSEFPPVYVTVDVVALTVRPEGLSVLLVERGTEPQLGMLALPGGFVRQDESLVNAARREMVEETGIAVEPTYLEQLASYGDVDRDPRARTVSIAYLAVLPHWSEPSRDRRRGCRLASRGRRHSADLDLAADHHRILSDGVERLRAKIEYTPLARPQRSAKANSPSVSSARWTRRSGASVSTPATSTARSRRPGAFFR